MKDEEYLPSAGMAWVGYDEKYFYANVLGDCEVTFITKDNQIVRCIKLEKAFIKRKKVI